MISVETLQEIVVQHPELPQEAQQAVDQLLEQASDPQAQLEDLTQAIATTKDALRRVATGQAGQSVHHTETPPKEAHQKPDAKTDQLQQQAETKRQQDSKRQQGDKQEKQEEKNTEKNIEQGGEKQPSGSQQQQQQGEQGQQGQRRYRTRVWAR